MYRQNLRYVYLYTEPTEIFGKWNPLTFWNMLKGFSLESRNIQTQNFAPIQCTVWPRNEEKNELLFLKNCLFSIFNKNYLASKLQEKMLIKTFNQKSVQKKRSEVVFLEFVTVRMCGFTCRQFLTPVLCTTDRPPRSADSVCPTSASPADLQHGNEAKAANMSVCELILAELILT